MHISFHTSSDSNLIAKVQMARENDEIKKNIHSDVSVHQWK
jgi:hypothetical protein